MEPIIYSSNHHFTIYPSNFARQVIRQVSFIFLRMVIAIALTPVYLQLAIGFNGLTGILQFRILERNDSLRFTVFEGLVITLTITAIIFSIHIFLL